ncbi:MAG: sulfite exporter TauE/SafE family protein [Myxococcota bacterium]
MFAVGLVLAIAIGLALGFFGGGGSILTVPLLVYVFGLPPKQAIASSLVVVALASTVSAVQHARAGNLRPDAALTFGSAGVVGAYLGGRASAWLDGGLLLLLFAAMMLLTAGAMWRGRRPPADPAAAAGRRSPLRLMLQGIAVGGFTGLVGAGGGFLIVPALALWAGLPMTAAVGTSLVIIVMNCIAGYLGYASNVSIDPVVVGGVASSAIAGALVGARLARRIDPASLRRGFALFVLAMGATILVREGALLVRTIGPALPDTWPQVAFALVMLALGAAAGRASTVATRQREEMLFQEGGGI